MLFRSLVDAEGHNGKEFIPCSLLLVHVHAKMCTQRSVHTLTLAVALRVIGTREGLLGDTQACSEVLDDAGSEVASSVTVNTVWDTMKTDPSKEQSVCDCQCRSSLDRNKHHEARVLVDDGEDVVEARLGDWKWTDDVVADRMTRAINLRVMQKMTMRVRCVLL